MFNSINISWDKWSLNSTAIKYKLSLIIIVLLTDWMKMFFANILGMIILIQLSTSNIARKFTTKSQRGSPSVKEFEFVKASVTWIGAKNMDNCFILNFGYEAPLPWPQVHSKKSLYYQILLSCSRLFILFNRLGWDWILDFNLFLEPLVWIFPIHVQLSS